MTYQSLGILCRRCLEKDIPEAELIIYLDEYISSLPENIRVSDTVYRMRLSECAECTNRINATCTLCGCYCQARAAKKKLACPIPENPRWTEDTTQ